MKISDFNLESIDSQLLNIIDINNNDKDLEVFINIDKNTLVDFNKRYITYKNVNRIIEILDYFLVSNVDKFIVKYSTPTLELYQINKFKLKKNNKEVEEDKFILPTFMTKGISIKNYKYEWISDNIFENNPRNCLEEMAYHGCLNWIKFTLEEVKYEIDCKKNLISSWAAYGNHFNLIKYLDENNISKIDENTLYGAVSCGNEDLVQYVLTKIKSNYKACSYAALSGNLNCLRLCWENNNEWDLSTLVGAASSGSLECMKFAFINGCSFTYAIENYYDYSDTLACEEAAIEDNLECFKFAYFNGCPLGSSLSSALRYENLELAKIIWSLIKRDEITDYEFEILSRICIKNNDLESLKFAHEVIKSPLDGYEGFVYNLSLKESEHATLKACEFNNLEMLDYLLKNGMNLDKLCFEEAISSNSINLIEYILSLDEEVNKKAIEHVKDKECEIAFQTNNYEVLEYLYKNGFKLGERWCPNTKKINFKDLDERCWNFAKKHKITFIDSDNYCWLSNYNILNKCKEFNFNWNVNLPALMASYGNIEKLKYLHQNGCPWNSKTTLNSCYFERYSKGFFINYRDDYKSNHFECLKYSLENNCSLHDDCLEYAIISTDMDVIEYLLNNNCTIKDNIFDKVINKVKNIEQMFKIIKLLLKFNSKFTIDNLKTAINLSQENIELIHLIIKNLVENKIKLTSDVFNKSIEMASLNIIKLLNEYNCPYDSDCYIYILKKRKIQTFKCNNYFEIMTYLNTLNIDKSINLNVHLEDNNNYNLKSFIITFFLKNGYTGVLDYLNNTKDRLYLRLTLEKLDKNEKYYNFVKEKLNNIENTYPLPVFNDNEEDY